MTEETREIGISESGQRWLLAMSVLVSVAFPLMVVVAWAVSLVKHLVQ